MGARSGGASGLGRGAVPTEAQVKAAHESYKKAKAAYDKAAQALNNYAAGISPTGPKPEGNYEQISSKFLKASDKFDKAHDKWSKMKQAKKIADYNASTSPKSGISYSGVSTSTKGWNAQMKKAYKDMTTTGGYGAKVAKQIINSQKNVYQGEYADIPF